MRKIMVLPVLIVFAISLLLASANDVGGETVEGSIASEGLGIPGIFCISVNSEPAECSPNTMTNAGKEAIENQISGVGGAYVNSSAFRYLAVGNGTAPVAASTILGAEVCEAGLSRASGGYMDYSAQSGNWSISKQFSVTATAYVNTTGIFNDTTNDTGVILSGASFTGRTVANGDTLNVTVIYSIS